MDDADGIEPLGFFSLDALRAGWYLTWRWLIRIVPATLVIVLAAAVMAWAGLGLFMPVVASLAAAAVTIWAVVLIPRLTIQWAEQWYGVTLTGQVRIGWGVIWRVLVASLVAAVIETPPQFVALSLTTAFPGSALGLLGGALNVALVLVSAVVSLLAMGWAMSKTAVAQIGALTAMPTVPAPRMVPDVRVRAPLAPDPIGARVTAAAATPGTAVAPAASSRPLASARPQCPKCGLHETERGSVIGWYCRICGWREGKGR